MLCITVTFFHIIATSIAFRLASPSCRFFSIARMPPICHCPSIRAPTGNRYTGDLTQIAILHGGKLPHHLTRHLPYDPCISAHQAYNLGSLSIGSLTLPSALLDKIRDTQEAAVNESTRRKDASRLSEFLSFCKGLGIRAEDALPAREEVLLAWASSYAGRLAGNTVGAKMSAIRKEHERRGIPWFGGNRLRSILKGVEELRPPSTFYNKRVPITISMLEI